MNSRSSRNRDQSALAAAARSVGVGNRCTRRGMPNVSDNRLLADRRSPHRRGTALLVVLVVVTLLSLAAYTFSELMVTESRASRQYSRDAQVRELANSAVEYVAANVGNPELDLGELPNYYHNPALFENVTVVESDSPEGRGWFSVVAPVESDAQSQSLRFGLMNESSRLNLNTLLDSGLDEDTQRYMLVILPGMTDDIADSILDWLDEDESTRAYGAESDYYLGMVPAYYAKNGPIESIDELLLVRDMTPELLYGEDSNRNGILDPNENDGSLTLPEDNADGVLDLGLYVYLTMNSLESNLRPDGSSKIDVNQSLLTELYDQIAEEYDEDVATFITAYRLFGATNVEPLDLSAHYPDNSTGDVDTDAAIQNLATSIARSLTGGSEGTVTRGGLDLSQGATVEIESLFELIGAEVDAQVNGQPATLTSPYSVDYESVKDLMENFSNTSSSTLKGRININEAREPVLLSIPTMPEELAAAIVATRPSTGEGSSVDDVLARRTNTGWLLVEGLADVTTMRMIDAYVTTGGSVYRLQAVGRFGGPGPSARVEAILDASGELPKLTFRQDLTDLGTGYALEQLQPSTQSR
ncbi:MAG: general secretion pathway protein GspK [Planctomycetaceae bacterium]|nr:general secretion pathway protein GspK [Planctomycetaceae bacterium]